MRTLATFFAKIFWSCIDILEKLIMAHSRCYWRIDFRTSLAHVHRGLRDSKVALHPGWGVGSPAKVASCGPKVARQLNWLFMHGRESKSLALEVNWPIKILSFCSWSRNIVFASHHLKIFFEIALHCFSHESFMRLWIDWLSAVPVVPINDKIDEITYLAF